MDRPTREAARDDWFEVGHHDIALERRNAAPDHQRSTQNSHADDNDEWNALRKPPREIAILTDHYAAVRLWLDRSGPQPLVVIEDLEGEGALSLSAADLSDLIIARRHRHVANRAAPHEDR